MATTTTTATAAATSAPSHVHFDDTCVLIPDPVQSRMPRLIKKSYSLPIWRKRSNSNPPADFVEATTAPATTAEERGMVITVFDDTDQPDFVSFSRSRSQSRSESPQRPLIPCIVNTGTAPRSHSHVRRPSLPLPLRPDAMTIPLRPCCKECFRTTEECLKKGHAWEEKFTRGARRLMNSGASVQAHAHAQRHRRVQDDVPGFGAVVSVDEIDIRHGISSDGVPGTSAAPQVSSASAVPRGSEIGLLPSISRRLQVDESDPKTANTPITEEDEELSDTGFPLPSPRRTPRDSPSASSSHLPQDAPDDNVSLLLQAVSDNHALQRALAPQSGPSAHLYDHDHDRNRDDDDDAERGPDGQRIMSVYYTPDSSPAIPALEPSFNVSAPNTPVLMTPPTPHPIARFPSDPPPGPIPIPAPRARSQSQPYPSKFFAGIEMSMSPPTFDSDAFNSPSSSPFDTSTLPPLPPPPPAKDYRPRYSMSGSPDLADLPVLTSASPSPPDSPGSPNSPGRRRGGLHMPHLPRAGSFLRAGAEMLKGVGSLGSGSGPLPVSV
ncbi:hypothetical protein EIP86_004432 [Pleurotus ostreatoroseus]|nr:hypothetical protein EIP86_004432 [Pleurotus ostreatoroseus]